MNTIEGLNKKEIKVTKIKEFYFKNNKKKVRIIDNIETLGSVFALIYDENNNIYLYNSAQRLSGSKFNLSQIIKGEKYIIYTCKKGNKYDVIDYITLLGDKLEIESLPIHDESIPYEIFNYTKHKEDLLKDIQGEFKPSLLYVGTKYLLWILEHSNINNKLYMYVYIYELIEEICKTKVYKGTNAKEIYEIFKIDIDNKFKEINIDEILIELTNGNILRKNQNNNYFPRHLED